MISPLWRAFVILAVLTASLWPLERLAAPAHAQTPVTLSPSKDNTLFSESGSESSGVGVSLFVGRTNGGNVRRALVHFDIAGTIPAGSTIDSVVLTLNMSRTNAGAQTIQLHKLTADWGEGNSNSAVGGGGRGASAQSGDATWTHGSFGDASSSWTSAGGDFSSAVSASASVAGTGSYTLGTTAQMVSDVQEWLDDASNNFGWILTGNEGVNRTTKRFDSRENPTAGNRPILEVTYTADTTPPAAPTNLTASDTPNDEGGAIDLSWTPSISTDATQQRLYRGTSSGSYDTLVQTFAISTSSHTDTGLSNGVPYYYVVTALDAASNTATSTEASATPADNVAPAQPTAVTAADSPNDGGAAIDLSWTPSISTDVTQQRLYRGTSSGSHDTLVQTFTTTSSHTDTGLTDGVPYYYVVTAVDAASNTATSTEASATPADNLAPAAPTGLAATTGDQQATLQWDANGEPDLDGYNLYRSTTSGGGYAKVNGPIVTTTGFTDSGLTNGSAYYYVVSAVDTSGNESADSSEASVTPLAPPAGLTATAFNGYVSLDWADYTELPVAGYNVYRSATSGGPYNMINASLLADSVHPDASVTNGITYYYVVTALDTNSNESPYSLEVVAAPSSALPTIPGLTPWGLAAVAGMLMGAVLWRLRRRTA